jgi:transmembrane sensor
MSAFGKLSATDQERLEAASEWWSRIQHDPSVELSSEFLNWMSDADNHRALSAVESTMMALDDLGATPKILDMRRAALTRLRHAGSKRWAPRKLLLGVAAAFFIAVVGAPVAYVWSQMPTSYATGVGERRVVALADGSRISMDSDSAIRVKYTRVGRTITLDQGRARFDVAHDITRPFTVTAGSETVVAVGTSFNVERLGSKVLVTLIQGHVLIKNADLAPLTVGTTPAAKPSVPHTVSMSAGEQMVAVANTEPVIEPANIDTASAWEAGHLVFRGETLAEAVERVNRYTDHPISVDPSAAAIRISGVFNAGDVGSFVSAITGLFPVQATTDANDAIKLQKKS